ncbi:MAG: hypothetical protein J6T23_01640, partial [Elusimicrobia bacterium]|nr:hypothetical protein [Elusimicrobiota bacterium]
CRILRATAFPFDCTLCGPFNKLLTACFSPPRLAVSALLIFISASTVSILNFQDFNIILFKCQVKNFASRNFRLQGNIIINLRTF